MISTQPGVVAGSIKIDAIVNSTNGVEYVGISEANAQLDSSYQTPRTVDGLTAGFFYVQRDPGKNFSWKVDCTSCESGQKTYSIIVIDKAGQTSTASITFTIKSVKPQIQVISPSSGSTVKGKVTFLLQASATTEVGRTIKNVGISESGASSDVGNGYSTYYAKISTSKYPSIFSLPSNTSTSPVKLTVSTSKMAKEQHKFWFAVEDSAGDITETSITLTIAQAQPTVVIASGSQSQTFAGPISFDLVVKPDPSSSDQIQYVGSSVPQLVPQFAGSEQGYGVGGFPSNYKVWKIQNLSTLSFSAPAGSIKNGSYTATFLVADESGASGTASISFTVQTLGPNVTFTSDTPQIVAPGTNTLSGSVTPNAQSGGSIAYIGINASGVKPMFTGSLTQPNIAGLPSGFAYWIVQDQRTPKWTVDTSSWKQGDNTISIIAIDSNGQFGQATTTINLAPSGTWTLSQPTDFVAVLGKSVPINVEMATNYPYRSQIPVTLTFQKSSNSTGPWTDIADLALDPNGKASGSVVVEGSMYIRVLHKQLDSVQPGFSQPLRIVPQADPSQRTTGTGLRNKDGSIPKITCTPNPSAKIGTTVLIKCTPVDFQTPTQKINLYVLSGGKWKPLAVAKYDGIFIQATAKYSTKSSYSFKVVGEMGSNNIVTWTSNTFTISWK